MAVDFASLVNPKDFPNLKGGADVSMANIGTMNSTAMGQDVANMKAPAETLSTGVAGQSF